jgi:hypothetical protein
MSIDAALQLEASFAVIRAARDLLAMHSAAPEAVSALDRAIALVADLLPLDDLAADQDALDRATAIGTCPACGTACFEEHGAHDTCSEPRGCGALNGTATGAAEALRTAMRQRLAASARRKLRGRVPERCDDGCRGWYVANGGEVQRCDVCWSGLPEAESLLDEEAAALPEALIALAHMLLRGSL